MPTEKPLPETDDIIDLTDLVDEAGAGGGAADKEPAADMSFEQELDDLFGDVEPDAPKAAPAKAPADDDVIDLAGMELSEPEAEPAAADQDIVDLAGLDLDEPAAAPQQAAKATAPDDDLMDLSGLDFDEPSPAPATAAKPATADDDLMDLSDLSFDTAEEPAPKAAATPEPEAPSLEDALFKVPEPALEEPELPADLEPEAAPEPHAEPIAASTDEALDISELSGLAPLEESPAPKAAAAAQPAPAQSIDLDALDKLILTAKGPAPEVEEAPSDELMAAWTARIDALEAATTALTSQIQDIPPMPDSESLVARLEALLTERFDALRAELAAAPQAASAQDAATPDQESLIADLRAALAPDFDALRQSLPATDDLVTHEGLSQALTGLREGLSVDMGAVLETAKQAAKTEAAAVGDALTARIEALEAAPLDPDALAERVRAALLPDLPDVGAAIAGVREGLSVDLAAALQTAKQAAKDEATAVADALASRIEALEAQHVDVQALTDSVREALLPDLPDVNAAVAGVREGLAVDLGAVLQTAKQTAKDAARAMGDALADRLTTLETDRIDPDALAERIRQGLLPAEETIDAIRNAAQQAEAGLENRVTKDDFQAALTELRAAIDDDIRRRIPQTAAALLRQEIAVLIKEFS